MSETSLWDQEAADRLIPAHMHDALRDWIVYGHMPGRFLTAVLENDLMEAAGRADLINRAALADYATFLYNYAPQACHGSPEKVKSWERSCEEERADHG